MKKKKTWKQLSYEERVKIEGFLGDGRSIRWMAKRLGRSPNTIGRELRYKKVKGTYIPKKAHHKTYFRRYLAKRQSMKAALDPFLCRFIREKLEERWSPERMAGYLKQEGIRISTKAVYKFIYARSLERGLFWKRNKKKGGRKKQKFKTHPDGRRYIEERPLLDGSGHFEADFIVSALSLWCLLVVVDRYSRKTFIRLLPNRKHTAVARAFREIFENQSVKTLTLDNDIAFNCWKTLEKALCTKIFFCRPYRSWEKGLVENTNRWIRCFVPKRRDIRTVTGGEIREIESFLNDVPRQCLRFQTARNVYLEALKKDTGCPN